MPKTTMTLKQKAAPQADAEEEDDRPADIDAFRASLAKRLHMLVGNRLRRWCSCAEPSCKRARACCAPKGFCANPLQRNKPVSERQLARSRAFLARTLQKSQEELRAEWEWKIAHRSHKKS